MAMVHRQSKKLSVASNGSLDELYPNRQSQLFRELEILLELKPSTFSSNLLALPRELRDQVFDYVLPKVVDRRPELHTCLWGADMVNGEPWRHDIYGYGASVANADRLRPELLLINKQLRDELLEKYFRRSKLTLHAELRNNTANNDQFHYSPHILQLPMLKHVTHIRFYVEWNYTTTKHVMKERRLQDQVTMTDDLLQAMDKIIFPLQAIETIELSILFFWKYRSGKVYSLSMQDLFDLEDVFKRYAEQRWLTLLRTNKSLSMMSPNPSAGVGYKLSSEEKGTEQSGGMEIFVSQDLEDAMRMRRRSNVDFYGHYGISDPLPQPSYKHGAMI
ncbi:Nn.00g048760.m01.CDS01 [Neocucurbitaria sp. VM-36]